MNRDVLYVETSLLKIAYEERGPAGGFPVVLLHGWPDDVRTWDGVVARQLCVSASVIFPSPRGRWPVSPCRSRRGKPPGSFDGNVIIQHVAKTRGTRFQLASIIFVAPDLLQEPAGGPIHTSRLIVETYEGGE